MSRVDFVGKASRGHTTPAAATAAAALDPRPPTHPPDRPPPLEIQISRFTRPNGILPFSREHLPEYTRRSWSRDRFAPRLARWVECAGGGGARGDKSRCAVSFLLSPDG